MTKTTNYQLPSGRNRPHPNEGLQRHDHATLDAALKANADAIAAETTARIAGDVLVKLKKITVTSEIA